jgi:hypothetical protein
MLLRFDNNSAPFGVILKTFSSFMINSRSISQFKWTLAVLELRLARQIILFFVAASCLHMSSTFLAISAFPLFIKYLLRS